MDKTDLVLDKQLCFALYGASLALTRTYKPLLEPLGLTYPQYLAMMVLWETNHLVVKALGERLGLDSGTLSPLLKRLEQAGYVTRRRDSQDERQVTVSLTPSGAALQDKALDVMAAIGTATGCSLEEIAALRDQLQALRGKLNAALAS
ncbi:MarR family winged helix-turn-helix transcriptional regulator [Allorhizobium taibaishanense]|uniref:MarR family transcriptional regulator n=1 Tax=Allorhizobium taibaishanense TaxID=887144 RepID=A0A1Q9AC41_9HYPH|nr:MarR family transcriptional regulator [Allorhizobium taibaishanense]MBB4007165.1 DNA-binding MarR family transcriptional regulator [Allorhizobium taibaishanense]OLP52423.1 MarR family transcriptional regulator [Allorhizobium taibaishanense]